MAFHYQYAAIAFGIISILCGITLIIILYRDNKNKNKNVCKEIPTNNRDSCVGCNPKYKLGMQSYLQARNDLRIPQDPYINGYNNFCKDPSRDNWKNITGNTSGYNDFCSGVVQQGKCVLTNDEWVSTNHQWMMMSNPNLSSDDENDPDRNGYNQFCTGSFGMLEDWKKIWWVSNSSTDPNLSYQQYTIVNNSKIQDSKM
jgi:hypothetical protein